MAMTEILEQLMRGPGAGIAAFSAGVGTALPLQRRLYAAAMGEDSYTLANAKTLEAIWKESYGWIREDGSGQVALIGVPMDTGGGIRRGAAHGPRAIREAWLKQSKARSSLNTKQVVDLGDVWINPHLLHDEMLSPAQIQSCRDAMYPTASTALRSKLPVSGLSQLALILAELNGLYPGLKFMILGGDHSCAWPMAEFFSRAYPRTLGIVQPDAHTDLLDQRLGVKYCFGSWSYHANDAIGRGGKLVQLGVRESGNDQAHWEKTLGVKQFWAKELNSLSDDDAVKAVVAHLKKVGVQQVYFSNDVDGTDESEIEATGTPAKGGLRSSYLLKLIPALGKEFELVGADVMEVAPDLGPDAEARARTLDLAAKYLQASIEALAKR